MLKHRARKGVTFDSEGVQDLSPLKNIFGILSNKIISYDRNDRRVRFCDNFRFYYILLEKKNAYKIREIPCRMVVIRGIQKFHPMYRNTKFLYLHVAWIYPSRLLGVVIDIKDFSVRILTHLPALRKGNLPIFSPWHNFIICCPTPFCFIKMHDVTGYTRYQPIKMQNSHFKIRWNAINYSKLGHLTGLNLLDLMSTCNVKLVITSTMHCFGKVYVKKYRFNFIICTTIHSIA